MWALVNVSNRFRPIIFKARTKQEVEKFYNDTKVMYNSIKVKIIKLNEEKDR